MHHFKMLIYYHQFQEESSSCIIILMVCTVAKNHSRASWSWEFEVKMQEIKLQW